MFFFFKLKGSMLRFHGYRGSNSEIKIKDYCSKSVGCNILVIYFRSPCFLDFMDTIPRGSWWMPANKWVAFTGKKHNTWGLALPWQSAKASLPWPAGNTTSSLKAALPKHNSQELTDKEQSEPCVRGWHTRQEHAGTLRAQGRLSLPSNYHLNGEAKQRCMFIWHNIAILFPFPPKYELWLTHCFTRNTMFSKHCGTFKHVVFAYDCLLVLKSGTIHTSIKVWLVSKSNIPNIWHRYQSNKRNQP